MKTVYAVECNFAGSNSGSLFAEAWKHVRKWAAEVAGISETSHLLDQWGNEFTSSRGDTFRLASIEDGEQAVRRLTHEISHNDEGPGWITHVWVCRDGDRVWGVLRGGPKSRPGIIARYGFKAFRPKVVGHWIDEMTVVNDGVNIASKPWNLGLGDQETFTSLLNSTRRRLPIVGISKAIIDGEHKPLADPLALAHKLSGLAHVSVLDRTLSWNLSEVIGKRFSVYNGGIRIWWPGFTLEDDPFDHVLLMPDQIITNPIKSERFIVNRIWDIAVDAISPPTIESRLLRDAHRNSIELRLQQARSAAANNSGTIDEILEAYEDELTKNSDLEYRIADLEAENSEIREDLVRAKSGQVGIDERVEDEVDTVEEAVDIASSEAEHVIYLQSAFKSARESQYPNPGRVLSDLRVVNKIAKLWAEGKTTRGIESAFEQEGVQYLGFISDTAQRQYRTDYEIEVGGRRVLMGPHLRRGIGSVSAILRIYWYVDEASKQFYVGHVGRKLRDKSNRN